LSKKIVVKCGKDELEPSKEVEKKAEKYHPDKLSNMDMDTLLEKYSELAHRLPVVGPGTFCSLRP
jgi:hypothetical protein